MGFEYFIEHGTNILIGIIIVWAVWRLLGHGWMSLRRKLGH
jgi:hypothetical protein